MNIFREKNTHRLLFICLFNLNTEKPKKEASHTLSLLAEVLRNFANKSKMWIRNEPMNEQELNDAFQRVERWARNAPVLNKTRKVRKERKMHSKLTVGM
jgi:hypothetical protein